MQYIKTDGTITEVAPDNGKFFTLKELRAFCGDTVDIADMPDGTCFVLDDNGKINGLPMNKKATEIWKKAYPISEYPNNNDQLIVGDVLYGILVDEDTYETEKFDD